MRCWLLKIGEPQPGDHIDRMFRAGMLANHLADAGHDVVWWADTFDHTSKTQRFNQTTRRQIGDRLEIVCLYGRHYPRNVSIARLVNHYQVAAAFHDLARREPRPDVILAAMPTVELASEAVRYGREHGVPVIIDIRDPWPDIWIEGAPAIFRLAAKLAVWPWENRLRRSIEGATAIWGFTDGAIDWALSKVGRSRSSLDLAFPFAQASAQPPLQAIEEARRFWDDRKLDPDHSFIAVYFGSLTHRSRASLLVEAALLLPQSARERIRIVICGDGEARAGMLARANGLEHVLLPGWVDVPHLWALRERGNIGLFAHPHADAGGITNKVSEYLSGGLPILTSTRGELSSFISQHKCGIVLEDDSPATYARALQRLSERPDEVRAMTEGAARAAAALGIDTVIDRMVAHLERIAATAPHPPDPVRRR